MLDFDLRMALQIFGALLCIANYLLIQMRRITATQPASLFIVASGGVILLASAIMGSDWGLIMLEMSWLVMVSVTLVIRHREASAEAAAASAGAVVDTGAIAVGTASVETFSRFEALGDTGEIAVGTAVVEPAGAFDSGNTGELQLAGAVH